MKFISKSPKYSMGYYKEAKEFNKKLLKNIKKSTYKRKGETTLQLLNRINKIYYKKKIKEL